MKEGKLTFDIFIVILSTRICYWFTFPSSSAGCAELHYRQCGPNQWFRYCQTWWRSYWCCCGNHLWGIPFLYFNHVARWTHAREYRGRRRNESSQHQWKRRTFSRFNHVIDTCIQYYTPLSRYPQYEDVLFLQKDLASQLTLRRVSWPATSTRYKYKAHSFGIFFVHLQGRS